MRNWFNTNDNWFLSNRKYLYNDLLSEQFVKVHDEELSKNYYEFIPSDFDIALVEAIATEKSKYTNNNFIKDKIRQQLQVLRDQGIIEFNGRGNYKKI